MIKISDHIIKSIEEEKLNQQIVSSILERLSGIQGKNKESINNRNLKIILMTLLSVLKKNEVKLRKNVPSTLNKEQVNYILTSGDKFIFFIE